MIPFKGEVFDAVLVQRYKRFFADVRLSDGSIVTAHTPNTGSMKGLLDAGNLVRVSHDPSPKRKLQYTLQAIRVSEAWVGCNTSLPNALVIQGIESGAIKSLSGYRSMRAEVPYGQDNASRIDVFLSDHERSLPSAYVEVKNVTLRVGGQAQFPDSVTTRGQKHLRELMAQVAAGHRGVMVFVCQRTDCNSFAAAAEIDPVYAQALREAYERGVEVICVVAEVTSQGIGLVGELEFVCP